MVENGDLDKLLCGAVLVSSRWSLLKMKKMTIIVIEKVLQASISFWQCFVFLHSCSAVDASPGNDKTNAKSICWVKTAMLKVLIAEIRKTMKLIT